MGRSLTKVVDTGNGEQFEWGDPKDRETIAAWMQEDPDHAGLSPDLFLEERTQSLMFGDGQGDLLAIRVSRVMRLDIQFNPDPAARDRVRDLMMKEFPWLRDQALKCGFRQFIFDSISKPLIAFCRRRFGFKSSGDEYVSSI